METCTETAECKFEDFKPINRIWAIDYLVKGNRGKGIAVVKANNPKEASDLLVSSGVLNGNRLNYEITRIEEIVLPLAPDLVSEQVIFYNNE